MVLTETAHSKKKRATLALPGLSFSVNSYLSRSVASSLSPGLSPPEDSFLIPIERAGRADTLILVKNWNRIP